MSAWRSTDRPSDEDHRLVLVLAGAACGESPLVESRADLKAAKAAGKLGVAFDLEGSTMPREDVAMVEIYCDLGVRQTTWSITEQFGRRRLP